MRSFALNAFAAVSGLTAAVAATALTTIHPCPDCPKSIAQSDITVTAQYQAVSTCSAVKTTKKKKVIEVASCSTYDFVSTEIPYLGGASTTLVTKTDQLIEVNYVSTVLTSYAYTTYPASGLNGTKYGNATASTSTSTTYQTVVVDTWAPYDSLGPLALPPWEGSGLCKPEVCGSSPDVEKDQPVTITKCVDGVCSTYAETWVSTKPASTSAPSSTSETSFSTTATASSSGVNTIPVTATFTPSGGDNGYTAPVTSTFSITTSVPAPGPVAITKYITVTFTQEPAPTVSHSESVAPVSTHTYLSQGTHTIPIVTTCTPTGNPSYTAPVTTTVYYTTTVTGGPHTVYVTTTVTITFTSTVTVPPATVISGSTQSTSSPVGPTTVSATTTTTSTPPDVTLTSTATTSTTTTTSTTSGPTSTPTGSEWELYGCLGSTDGFPTFTLEESSGSNDIEFCTSECQAGGFLYAGLYLTDCYCASEVGTASTGKANGVCDLPCPGDASETCGGNAVVTRKRSAPNSILLEVFVYDGTPTSSSSSSTSEATSDPSSDPDPAPVRRGLDSDMESNARKARDIKLRRGGLLRNPKVEQGPSLAKRDFGLKQPFGQ